MFEKSLVVLNFFFLQIVMPLLAGAYVGTLEQPYKAIAFSIMGIMILWNLISIVIKVLATLKENKGFYA